MIESLIDKKLKDKAFRSLNSPGVYYFKNKKSEIIYVGKASNLKKRISSYFPYNGKSKKTIKMLSEVYDITWKKSRSEINALLKESREIKRIEPFYNVLLKDDKKYFYVVFTKDIFPKVFITHQPSKTKHDKIIGPFTDGKSLRIALSTIRKMIPFCQCRQKHTKPCLPSQLGLCPGYCCIKHAEEDKKELKVQKQKYSYNLKIIELILSGKSEQAIKHLKKSLAKFIEKEEFENAELVWKKIESIKNVLNHGKTLSFTERNNDHLHLFVSKESKKFVRSLLGDSVQKRIEAYDVSELRGRFATASMVVFELGQLGRNVFALAQKSDYRIFHLKKLEKDNDLIMLREAIRRRIKHLSKQESNLLWPAPDLILVDGGKNQLRVVLNEIQRSGIDKKIIISSLAKRQEKLYTFSYSAKSEKTSPIKNFYLSRLPKEVEKFFKDLRDEAHRFATRHHRVLRKKNIIK